MSSFVSVQQFLQGTRRAFISAIRKAEPVRIVVGNEAADLDSFASSVLYAYLSSHFPSTSGSSAVIPPTLPLLNIPRSDVSIRPEHAYLTNQLSFTLADVPTLSELPSDLNPSLTSISLVDHNVLQQPLSKLLAASNVVSIIDHHVDEKENTSADPRVISVTGSCASLVVQYFREKWESASIPAEINSELAKLALGPILMDTSNLTFKTTPLDVEQTSYLVPLVQGSFSKEKFYEELEAAKTDVEKFTTEELLRKDYKQWTEPNGVVMGVSVIPKCLAWSVNHAGGIEKFIEELAKWAKTRNIDTAIVMTTDTIHGKFRRDLLIWGCSERTRPFAQEFEDQGKEKFELNKWPAAEDDVEESFDGREGMKAWTQSSLELSRKQVAPFLRDIASKL